MVEAELSSFSKDEIKSLTLRFCGCYQSSGLSSFDFRLSVPLLSVNRFLFWSRGSLSRVLEGASFSFICIDPKLAI
nr:hypothetical protein CFP56_55556 [Quercus suber]